MIETTQPNPPAKPIIYLDASSLKDSACLRRFINTIFFGYKTTANRYTEYKLGYGSAWHRGLEFWYNSEDKSLSVQDQAIQIASDYYAPFGPFIKTGPKEHRTPTNLIKGLRKYFTTYNVDTETLKPLKGVLESKFLLPWYSCDEFDLVLCGTIDMIADYCGRIVYVDHKTTSSWADGSYFKPYDISIQMMFYKFIIKRLTGREDIDCVINGIFLKLPTQKAEKEGLPFDGANFQRSNPIHYTPNQMQEFEVWLSRKISRVIEWLKVYFKNLEKPLELPPSFEACEGKWGLCPYFSVCSTTSEYQNRLWQAMARVPYEPLRFSET